MNPKRLLVAIVLGFIFFFVSDFIVHGVWMVNDYKATAELWRSETEMQNRFGWMLLGHLMFTIPFVLIWAKGFAATGCTRCALIHGTAMGLFFQSNTLITYVVSPIPAYIAGKWLFAGMLQCILLAVVVRYSYKPVQASAENECAGKVCTTA